MANMQRTRGKGLREQDIENLLANSDLEDFLPSDEDLDDPPYVAPQERISSSSTDDDSKDEDTHSASDIASHDRSGGRGNRGTRGNGSGPVLSCRGSRRSRGVRRGSVRRGRGSSNATTRVQNMPRPENVTVNTQEIPSSSDFMPTWTDSIFFPIEFNRSEPSYLVNDTREFNIFDYFYQYIDSDLVDLIVAKTNQTSVKLLGRSLNLNRNECYLYFGITLVMASVNYPQIRMYWENKWRVDIVSSNMSRNRFLQLRNSLKLVFDDEIDQTMRLKDKLWKMRPLIDRIQQGCRIQEKQDVLCIDEMIVPFTGSCGIKQYVPGKPNPEGLKIFVLVNPDGLVCDFHVYEGITTYPQYEESRFGLGEKAVLALADSLVPGHVLYFDRYFTSERLVDELLNRGIGCSGTIMKNKIPGAARLILMDDKELKDLGRGASQVLVRHDNKMALTKWYDNKAVTMLSSVEGLHESDICRRWCKREKVYVPVTRPRVIRNYNCKMGGVDLADRLMAICPYRYRTKKWTQRFLSHMVDMSVSNSWIIYKKDQLKNNIPPKKNLQLRAFKMALGEYLIDTYSMSNSDESNNGFDLEENIPRGRGRPTAPLPSKRKRVQGADHMPVITDKQSRCRQCHYKKSRIHCSTCNVFLCLTSERNCYWLFHS